ncbi:ATPase V0 complex subunit D [Punctularia strigosozonata HHB-11173 SS5]|uniref:ATPase V0 complex subunit D n=1 Tax=Punctularia strigosozonata (strain HHB-11173) TaxID=741275 RepID=UPI00044186BC|nr:ATPase V0 complex subunit D [Punctularia strigosozonata HHB-11173 SS5]EIN12630.1 ATPase V0 complex subunit D [Punctularia strigosozonata HHB-11173 SS5]
MEGLFFNSSAGFLEGIVRGYKAGLLTQPQYANLTQCETLDDFRMQLSATDYGNFLANEPSPISTSTIADKATQVLVDQFNYLRSNSVEPLSKFLDYITYGYMIDNVILLITGTLHERDTHELLERCHPLGVFDTMPALCVATNVEELYHTVLVETPLAPYFRECLSAADLDDLNIEIIRNTLYKAYLEDFDAFASSLGGPTADAMHAILAFEADRRSINITVNSFGTELSKEQRARLFPTIGRLFPAGNNALAKADELDQVRQACEGVQEYRALFDATGGPGQANGDADASALAAQLEDRFFATEVELNKKAFLQQFQHAVFYAYVKLKEQEIRSITWIAECIAQNARDRIQDFIPTF